MISTAWRYSEPIPAALLASYSEQEDSYVSACFALDIEELAEDHDFRDIDVLRRVDELASRGRLGAAMELLDQASLIAPEYTLVYQYKSNVAYLMGDRQAAVAALERALELEPDNALFRQNLERLQTRGNQQ